MFRGHQTSIDELLKQADLAMYKSKELGRDALCFFDPAMQTVVVERAALEADLRKAIEDNQFLLHYQAQVADGDRVTGAEALVRWRHPQRGIVPPADFIPLAEETGLILALGNWVLETACTQLMLWSMRPEMAHLTIAVNVSAQQLREPDFVDKVLTVIRQTGARANRLKLELTESVLVDNVQDIIQKMYALKAKGVVFSLDDFGIGYSSLSYLKRLPLDQLKIDQSFVRDVLVDPNERPSPRRSSRSRRALDSGLSPRVWRPARSGTFSRARDVMPIRGITFAGRCRSRASRNSRGGSIRGSAYRTSGNGLGMDGWCTSNRVMVLRRSEAGGRPKAFTGFSDAETPSASALRHAAGALLRVAESSA